MIKLFNIPNHVIDTSWFSNILHDEIRSEYEQNFANYVGAEHAVGVTSCTDAIFLVLKSLEKKVTCKVPSLSTTRFLNAIIHSGNTYEITDNTKWVGNEYVLYEDENLKVIDSAQKVEFNQFKGYNDNDVIVFSNYPTKPVGGLRGGIIVSNDKERIDWIRQAAFFGENFSVNSWEGKPTFIGWQMYMDSIQAYLANQNLQDYYVKRKKLDIVRDTYYASLKKEIVTGDSYHLFRVNVGDNVKCLEYMKNNGVICGIHYKPIHLTPVYNLRKMWDCRQSERDGFSVISIPFHEELTFDEMKIVIDLINKF